MNQNSTSRDAFESAQQRSYDKIVIAGGGMAALFTAYEILQQAEEAGKKIDVLVLADQFSAPCKAGTHCVLSLDGFYEPDAKPEDVANTTALLRAGLEGLRNTIARENISCRAATGYEVKGKTQEALDASYKAMTENGIYTPDELTMNADTQTFMLPGHPYSMKLDKNGQVNMPELVEGMIQAIRRKGGDVRENIQYVGQHKEGDEYVIETNRGEFRSFAKPFIATGAEHQRTLPGYNVEGQTYWSMGLVLGPLSEEDARKISKGPMAISNTSHADDVVWGGLDEQNYLTLGRGNYPDKSEKSIKANYAEIEKILKNLYPGLVEKYPPNISYGALLGPKNGLPVVGRMPDYDVSGGWGGRGIVPGYAAAIAYAKCFLKGDDAELKIFENMHPEMFSPAPGRDPNATLHHDTI